MLYYAVNGQECNLISLTNRGLAYGDGVFTTAKIINGQVEYLDAHITRLQDSCHKLNIPAPDVSSLKTQLLHVGKSYQLAVLKVMITAGEGSRGYSRIGCHTPTIIVVVFDYPSHYPHWQEKGISLGQSTIQLGINPLLAGIKHLNRLEQVLIKQELDTFSFDDVVVTDLNNNIVEASSANLFWFKGDELYTSELINAGVAGIVREQLLKLSQQGILPPINIVKKQLSTLESATSIFLTNCVMGIVPVSCYERRRLDIAPVIVLQQVVDKHND